MNTKKENLRHKIKHLRLALGLTQTEFAKKLQIKQSTIEYYELGLRKPNMQMLGKISQITGVKLEFFDEADGIKSKSPFALPLAVETFGVLDNKGRDIKTSVCQERIALVLALARIISFCEFSQKYKNDLDRLKKLNLTAYNGSNGLLIDYFYKVVATYIKSINDKEVFIELCKELFAVAKDARKKNYHIILEIGKISAKGLIEPTNSRYNALNRLLKFKEFGIQELVQPLIEACNEEFVIKKQKTLANSKKYFSVDGNKEKFEKGRLPRRNKKEILEILKSKKQEA